MRMQQQDTEPEEQSPSDTHTFGHRRRQPIALVPLECLPSESGLSVGAFATYVVLQAGQTSGGHWLDPGPPAEALAKQVGVTVQDVELHLHELHETGWVGVKDADYYYPMWGPSFRLCDYEPEWQEPSGPSWEHVRMAKLAVRDFGWRCFYCAVPLIPRGAPSVQEQDALVASVDHVIPRTRGGKNTIDNVVLACRPCNSSKGNLTPEEWMATTRDRRPTGKCGAA